MANQGSYQITIRAIDATTSVVAKINKSIVDQNKKFGALNRSSANFGKELQRFGKITGVTEIAKSVSSLSRKLVGAVESAGKFIFKMAGLTSLLSAGGLVLAIEQWAKYNTSVVNAARNIGVTVKTLQTYTGMANLAGISTDTATTALTEMSTVLEDAVNGRNMDAANAYKALGVQIRGVGPFAKSTTEVLDDLNERFQGVSMDAGKAAAFILKLRTLGVSKDLIPLITMNRADYTKLKTESENYAKQQDASSKATQNFAMAQRRLGLATHNLMWQINEALSPALTELYNGLKPLVDEFANWIRQNSSWVTPKITEWARSFVSWVRSINWATTFGDIIKWVQTTITWVEKFATKVDDVAQALGGWDKVLAGLAALYVAGKFAAIATGIGLIAVALSNPVVLAALAAWALYYKATEAYRINTQADYDKHMGGFSPDSPMWRDIPEETQRQYPNSPYWQHQRREDISPAHRWSDEAFNRTGPATTGAVDALADEAYQAFIEEGLSPKAAAAMAGQGVHESKLGTDADTYSTARSHRGVFQWSQQRRAAILKATGIDVWDKNTSLRDQVRAASWELHNTHKPELAAMEGATNTYEAGYGGASHFESGGSPDAFPAGEYYRRADTGQRIFNRNNSALKITLDRLRHQQEQEAAPPQLPIPPAPTPPPSPAAAITNGMDVTVAFNGFPANLFRTMVSGRGDARINTSRTAGPIFAV